MAGDLPDDGPSRESGGTESDGSSVPNLLPKTPSSSSAASALEGDGAGDFIKHAAGPHTAVQAQVDEAKLKNLVTATVLDLVYPLAERQVTEERKLDSVAHVLATRVMPEVTENLGPRFEMLEKKLLGTVGGLSTSSESKGSAGHGSTTGLIPLLEARLAKLEAKLTRSESDAQRQILSLQNQVLSLTSNVDSNIEELASVNRKIVFLGEEFGRRFSEQGNSSEQLTSRLSDVQDLVRNGLAEVELQVANCGLKLQLDKRDRERALRGLSEGAGESEEDRDSDDSNDAAGGGAE